MLTTLGYMLPNIQLTSRSYMTVLYDYLKIFDSSVSINFKMQTKIVVIVYKVVTDKSGGEHQSLVNKPK